MSRPRARASSPTASTTRRGRAAATSTTAGSATGSRAAGWTVREHAVAGRVAAAGRRRRAPRWPACWPPLPDGAVVLVDGLVAVGRPGGAGAGRPRRLRLVVLVHMPLGEPTPTPRAASARCWPPPRAVVDHQRLDPRAGCSTATALRPGPGARRRARASTRRRRRRAPPTGGELLCVAAVTPAKGHDVLLAALADARATCAWRCTLRRLARPRPGVRRRAARGRPATAGSPTGCAFTGAAAPAPTLDGVVRRRRPAGAAVPGRRPTAWSSTEALARGLPVLAHRGRRRARGARAGAGRHACRGCWCRPATPAALAARAAALARRDDRRCAATLRARPRGSAARSLAGLGRRPPTGSTGLAGLLTRWPAMSAAGRGAGSRLARRASPSWPLLVWRLGTGPFLDGLRAVDAAVAAASARCIAVPTTVCCAWRWRLVAARPRVPSCRCAGRRRLLPLAVPQHGAARRRPRRRAPRRAARARRRRPGRGLRAVVWERLAGQVVQVGVAARAAGRCCRPRSGRRCRSSRWRAAVVACWPSCGRRCRIAGGPVLRADAATSGAALRGVPGRASLLRRVLAVAGHVATFLVAARTAGVDASPARLLPLGAAGAAGDGASRSTSPAGGRARAWPPGRSRRPGSAPRQGVDDRGRVRRAGARREPARRRRPAGVARCPAHRPARAGPLGRRRCAHG